MTKNNKNIITDDELGVLTKEKVKVKSLACMQLY